MTLQRERTDGRGVEGRGAELGFPMENEDHVRQANVTHGEDLGHPYGK